MKPEDLKGKSGHLTIHIDYRNNTKKTVDINGKAEMYSPFVMMTGLILPNETFSNVVIDNGKVISDGNKNIVFGFVNAGNAGEPRRGQHIIGWNGTFTSGKSQISADVKDFTMSSTFTVALNDLLDDLNLEEIGDTDALKNAVDELEDAALQLVDGSAALSDGVVTLSDSYGEFDEGNPDAERRIDVLSGGCRRFVGRHRKLHRRCGSARRRIRQYLGENGELTVKVTRICQRGVITVVQGVKDYADGANTLADGVTFILRVSKLAEGAGSFGNLAMGLLR